MFHLFRIPIVKGRPFGRSKLPKFVLYIANYMLYRASYSGTRGDPSGLTRPSIVQQTDWESPYLSWLLNKIYGYDSGIFILTTEEGVWLIPTGRKIAVFLPHSGLTPSAWLYLGNLIYLGRVTGTPELPSRSGDPMFVNGDSVSYLYLHEDHAVPVSLEEFSYTAMIEYQEGEWKAQQYSTQLLPIPLDKNIISSGSELDVTQLRTILRHYDTVVPCPPNTKVIAHREYVVLRHEGSDVQYPFDLFLLRGYRSESMGFLERELDKLSLADSLDVSHWVLPDVSSSEREEVERALRWFSQNSRYGLLRLLKNLYMYQWIHLASLPSKLPAKPLLEARFRKLDGSTGLVRFLPPDPDRTVIPGYARSSTTLRSWLESPILLPTMDKLDWFKQTPDRVFTRSVLNILSEFGKLAEFYMIPSVNLEIFDDDNVDIRIRRRRLCTISRGPYGTKYEHYIPCRKANLSAFLVVSNRKLYILPPGRGGIERIDET